MAKVTARDDSRWRTRAIAVSIFFVLVVLALIFYASGGLTGNQDQYCSNIKPDSTDKVLSSSPDQTKIATIIENRPLANLIPLILAFSAVLGPSWPIRIFHSHQNDVLFKSSPSINRMIDSNQVTLRYLPPGLNFTVHEPVSAFFATPWLWENLAPAKHILMFQTDSILCANSLRRVDDFLEYDFIGAPIKIANGHNYNGGLSLRNREKMLEVLEHFTRLPDENFEDQWFAQKLRELPPRPNGEPAANLPSMEVASQFSVESIWKDKPFGMHQISRWHPDKLDELKTWCPEYQLAIEGGLHPFHKTNPATLEAEANVGPDLIPFQEGTGR